MFGIPILIVAVLGLAFAGIINVPGVTPEKKKAVAAKVYSSDKDQKPPKKASTPPKLTPPNKKLPPPKVTVTTKDIDKGAEQLAAVWDEMPVDKIVPIAETWKDPDLVRVFSHMDTGKVAKILAAVKDVDRASRLSRQIQEQGSVVVTGDDAKTP
jgi:hypothetical protein